jgi:hypothetical protein
MNSDHDIDKRIVEANKAYRDHVRLQHEVT